VWSAPIDNGTYYHQRGYDGAVGHADNAASERHERDDEARASDAGDTAYLRRRPSAPHRVL
jgi:hypothetical protein